MPRQKKTPKIFYDYIDEEDILDLNEFFGDTWHDDMLEQIKNGELELLYPKELILRKPLDLVGKEEIIIL